MKSRRQLVKHPVPPKNAKKYIAEETAQTSPPFRIPPYKNQEQHPEFPPEHQYCLLPGREKCGSFVYKDIDTNIEKISMKVDKKVNLISGKLRLHGD